MHTIRSFIAIPLSPIVSRGATRLIERLREAGDGVKWVPLDSLHLTLKFLGDVDNTEVPKICQILREICGQFEPFELSFGGTGGFPSLEKPRVLYVGVEDPSGSLVNIVGQLETRLADLGYKPEARDYTPHLTIARAGKSRKAIAEVAEKLATGSIELGQMDVNTVHLMASFLDKTGPTYQVMDRVEL
jgi:2'-5' RNA ligase